MSTCLSDANADEGDAIPWKWRRHHVVDYVATGVFATGAIVAEVVPERDEPRLSGPFGFDEAFRDAFVLHDFDDRKIAGRISDITLGALVVHRIIDTTLVTWAGHRSGDAAWQMMAIDLQAMAFSLGITNATKRAFERERPSGTACRTEAGYDQRCREQSSDGSFYSGHTSLAFTAAGLACVHHLSVPLYGGDGDVVTCIASALAAASVAFERTLADRHYISDVMLGSAVGVFSGAVMPFLSFYARPQNDDALVSWSVAPLPSPYGGGLSLRGFF
jgi:membrane-associated phospholipid phosphatase